ncbi:hypothetical protein MA16_Dca028541 [Dendrobium catenatum]|uniref:DUF1664 domain-containing protein n=1 Tax=Dendrobium catenatum TaxID=906689 RepID=A0A2I0VAD9_9ASPA|nr:hypothetical protein MA16_Dca028541 [Dendrobium catenatum]
MRKYFLDIQGWSFSDVMFVTKRNMANAVANVSKQLEQLSTALTTTKRHLTQRLEKLDYKLDEQKESTEIIMKEVSLHLSFFFYLIKECFKSIQ